MAEIGEKCDGRAEVVDEKERAIIEAARKTFLARGYDAASMDAIALEAGVSKRTVYNRFASKEALFAAAILATCERLLPVNVEDLEASLSPPEFIDALAHQFLRGLLEPEAIALRRIATFEAGRNPELGRTYLSHGPKWMVEATTPLLRRVAARSGLDIEDHETAIWQLGALITEPLYTEVLLGQAPKDMNAAIDRQIDQGLTAFWKIYSA